MKTIASIELEILQLNEQLKQIREECSHPVTLLVAIHKYGAETDGYAMDCRWTEYHCGLCGKKWSKDRNK